MANYINRAPNRDHAHADVVDQLYKWFKEDIATMQIGDAMYLMGRYNMRYRQIHTLTQYGDVDDFVGYCAVQ